MLNTKPLVIASLISLVGEDKLYAYLNDIQYMYVTTFSTASPSIFMFRTTASPIEWLIFNKRDYFITVIVTSEGNKKK